MKYGGKDFYILYAKELYGFEAPFQQLFIRFTKHPRICLLKNMDLNFGLVPMINLNNHGNLDVRTKLIVDRNKIKFN